MQVLLLLIFSRLSSYHLSSIVKKREYRLWVRHIIGGGGGWIYYSLWPGRGENSLTLSYIKSECPGQPRPTELVQWSVFQVMPKWQTKFRSVFQSNAKTKNEIPIRFSKWCESENENWNWCPFFKVMRKRKTKYEVQNRFSKLGENEKRKAKFKSVFQYHAKTKNGYGNWIPFPMPSKNGWN